MSMQRTQIMKWIWKKKNNEKKNLVTEILTKNPQKMFLIDLHKQKTEGKNEASAVQEKSLKIKIKKINKEITL